MISNGTKFSLEEDEKYERNVIRAGNVASINGRFSVPKKESTLLFGTKVGRSKNFDTSSNNGVYLTRFVKDLLEHFKKKLGFASDCLNGGTATLKGGCICPKYYRGQFCEELVCINNGTLATVPKSIPKQYACRCPHPEYIHGVHCEFVKCLNGGRPTDSGNCQCLDYWYTGQFCQDYKASWGAVVGVLLLCMVIIIICCVVCRLNLFPRKPMHSRRRRRTLPTEVCNELSSHRFRRLGFRDDSNGRATEIFLRMQATFIKTYFACSSFKKIENLLSDNGNNSALILRPHNNTFSSYVIHLDTLPVFNPSLISSVNSSKPLNPPPSYEEVMTLCSATQHVVNRRNCEILPPEYTPYPSPL
ncbi:unnamed protein product [Thelazia callipaeda]|uniref:EGF-like domain-containing protein n=1 Tax=Thelazia callipaeda TaxID=103827 RepID=A0A0N5CJA6_THECL|nr:unnamed protein product [Thelazia callipaeda]